ncbi:helix-turn-helix domain-containing protein [Achromobacter sp. KK8]|jgi:transcriptional regulator with XRE-family HTH domain
MTRTFGRNLTALRLQQGLTLAELAQQVGLHASYLSHIERGRRPPPKREDLLRIADALTASAAERQQLWDAAIWSVAVDGIDHMHGYGEQQMEGFIQRMAAPQLLRAVQLAVFPTRD